MPAVAVETSHRPGSVALAAAPGTCRWVELPSGGDLASHLMPALAGLVAAAGLTPGDLKLVVVGLGPGSFTGLRAGAAVAQVLAAFLPAPLVALSSLEGSPLAGQGGRTALCLDALRGEVQGTVYLDGREAAPPALYRPEEFAELLRRHAPPAGQAAAGLVAGSGVHLLAAARLDVQGWRLEPHEEWRPRADHLLRRGLARAREGDFTAPDALRPLYLRPAAAEEGRSAR